MSSRSDVDVAAIERSLAIVDRQLAALDAASGLDPNADFALKTEIGGIRSESRRTKERRLDRWDEQARRYVALMERKRTLEAQLARAQAAPVKVAATARIETVLRAMLRVGDAVMVAGFANAAAVTRLNAKSVSVRFASGHTERVEWSAVRPVEWERMYADWKASNPVEVEGNGGGS